MSSKVQALEIASLSNRHFKTPKYAQCKIIQANTHVWASENSDRVDFLPSEHTSVKKNSRAFCEHFSKQGSLW